MNLIADKHYDVHRYKGGYRADQIHALACRFCTFSVDVVALHKNGDKSGASRYWRARAKMVAHIHAAHTDVVTQERPHHANDVTVTDRAESAAL